MPRPPQTQLQPSFSNASHARLRPVEAEPPRGRNPYPLADRKSSSPLRPSLSANVSPVRHAPLKFDDPHPDGSPHKFFDHVDPSVAHEKERYKEIEIQIQERKARLARLEMVDREERAAYERRQQRREQEEMDQRYSRHQYPAGDAARTHHDSPLRGKGSRSRDSYQPLNQSAALRNKKPSESHGEKSSGSHRGKKSKSKDVDRSEHDDEKQRDVEIDPQVEGLDLTSEERSSRRQKDSVRNSDKPSTGREKRANSNYDQKGKHKSRDKSEKSSKSKKKDKEKKK